MRRIELVQSLEKEWPLLREEERLAGINDELPRVGLDFREVRIHSPVESEGVGNPPLDSPSQLRRRAIVSPPVRPRASTNPFCNRWIHVEHESTSESRQSVERARLREKGRVRALGGHPGIFRSGVLNLTHDVEIPALLVTRLVLDAFERDPDLDLVAVIG